MVLKCTDLVLASALIELEYAICVIGASARRFDRRLVLRKSSIYVCKGQRPNQRPLWSRGGFEYPEDRRQRAHETLISALSPSQALAWINCEARISSSAQNLTPQHLLVAG